MADAVPGETGQLGEMWLSSLLPADGGAFLVAGSAWSDDDEHVIVLRFDANGDLDPAFGDEGVARPDIAGANDFAARLLADADGRVLIAGGATRDDTTCAMVARLDPGGEMDAGFGQDGSFIDCWSEAGASWGSDMLLDPEGRIVVAGTAEVAADSRDVEIGRYLP